MKPKLAIVYLIVVLAPLALLGWVGIKMIKQITADEQRQLDERLAEFYAGELGVTRATIMEVLESVGRKFFTLTEQAMPGPEDIRGIVRSDRLVKQIFVLGDDRRFIHPPSDASQQTEAERQFFARIKAVWNAGDPLFLGNAGAESAKSGKSASSERSGWYSWFWGDGANLVYWRRAPSGRVIGIEVERMTFLGEIVGALPESAGEGGTSLRVLADASGRTIYQWGDGELAPTEASASLPDAELSLDEPLGMWRLRYYAAPGVGTAVGKLGKQAWVGLITAIALAVCVVVLLAWYFFREHSRQMRDAAQRVTFVNQVSHELKTPLTNIRMYAELAEEKSEGGEVGRYLDIVVDESQRLSRLIGNVLTFAKEQRGEVRVQPREGSVDRVIDATLQLFQPALERREIAVEREAGAGDPVFVDEDALEQILANLVSNVEKYGASGKWLHVASSRDGDATTVVVEDRGPGIPKSQRERIFDAFERISDRLTDGVSGTGIGLGIARHLARLHGGDLVLEEAGENGGCRFKLTLETPKAKS